MRSLLLAGIPIVLLSCPACVGIEILHQDELVMKEPHISTDRGLLHERGSRLSRYAWYPPESFAPPRVELLEHWGEPDEVRETEDGEIWTYRFGWRYTGVRLVVLLPIPLIVPIGEEYVDFVVRGDTVESARVVTDMGASYAVGLIPQMCGARIGVLNEGPHTWREEGGFRHGHRRLGVSGH